MRAKWNRLGGVVGDAGSGRDGDVVGVADNDGDGSRIERDDPGAAGIAMDEATVTRNNIRNALLAFQRMPSFNGLIHNPEDQICEILKDKDKRQITLEHLRQIESSDKNVAGIIPVESLKLNPLLTAKAKYSTEFYKKQRIAIQKWAVGGIANHQMCQQCGEEVSRKHAVDCSGALAYLTNCMGTLLSRRTNEQINRMDALSYLVHYKSEDIAKSEEKIKMIYTAIAKIYENCLGFQVNTNGFWSAPVDEPPESGIG